MGRAVSCDSAQRNLKAKNDYLLSLGVADSSPGRASGPGVGSEIESKWRGRDEYRQHIGRPPDHHLTTKPRDLTATN